MTRAITLALPGRCAGSRHGSLRQWVARGMRHIAEALSATAQRMAPAARQTSRTITLPREESAIEACAPEGAMTIDGIPFGQIESLPSR